MNQVAARLAFTNRGFHRVSPQMSQNRRVSRWRLPLFVQHLLIAVPTATLLLVRALIRAIADLLSFGSVGHRCLKYTVPLLLSFSAVLVFCFLFVVLFTRLY